MNEALCKDCLDQELRKGDLILEAWGWGSQFSVIRGMKQHLLTINVYQWDDGPAHASKGNCRPGARSLVRLDEIMIQALRQNPKFQARIERLLEEQNKVMTGFYDDKKK